MLARTNSKNIKKELTDFPKKCLDGAASETDMNTPVQVLVRCFLCFAGCLCEFFFFWREDRKKKIIAFKIEWFYLLMPSFSLLLYYF